MKILELAPFEREQFKKLYPTAQCSAVYAEKTAREWIDSHAAGLLSSIQFGIFRLVIAFMLERDGGERRNIQIGIDALLELGRAINENSRD